MRLFVFILLLTARAVFGAIYFVDFDGGNDASAGTSAGTAWKHIPGTRNITDTADAASSYGGGTFTTSAKVPAGTTFKLKGTHDSSDGGVVLITSAWYANGTAAAPITFTNDSGFSSGTVTFDATGMTVGISVVLVQRDCVTWDGGVTDGIVIQDSTLDGLQYKEQAGTSAALTNCFIRNLKFFNNSTAAANDNAGSGIGQISITKADGVDLFNLTVDGNNNWSVGMLLADSQKFLTNATIRQCTTKNLRGSFLGNDSGIGVKAFNSYLTITNCISKNNLKGYDLGEQNGNDREIRYKVINCGISNNYQGLNFNGPGPASFYAGGIQYFAINNTIVNNTNKGIRAYAGPWTNCIVGNIFYNNGFGDTNSNGEGCNLQVTPDSDFDDEKIIARVYNNIFLSPGAANLVEYYGSEVNDFTLDSDYNVYGQRAAESFCKFSYGFSPAQDYAYGTDGPGRTSGEWYSEYYTTATPPASGATGHFHCDAHSKGTGATDTSLPSLVDAANGNYGLSSSYLGTDLSAKPWFIAEMGRNADGTARTTWDMGPQDVPPVQTFVRGTQPIRGLRFNK